MAGAPAIRVPHNYRGNSVRESTARPAKTHQSDDCRHRCHNPRHSLRAHEVVASTSTDEPYTTWAHSPPSISSYVSLAPKSYAPLPGRPGMPGNLTAYALVPCALAVTLPPMGQPCFAMFACPALVIKRDCSYISIHFSLEIAEISLPIGSSGKSSGDLK